MYSSSKKRSFDADGFSSTRVSSMMREFDNQFRRIPKPRRSFVGTICFDDSSTTEMDIPVSKVQVLDTSLNDEESTSPSSKAVVDLRRRLVEKDLELQHAKATISHLKTNALNFEPESKKLSIEFEKQIEMKNRERDSLKDKLLRLTNHIQELEDQAASTQANYEEEKDSVRAECKKLTQKLKTVQIQKDELDTEFEKLKLDKSATVKQLQNEVMKLKLELRLCNDEKTRLEQQHKSVVKLMQEKVVEETLKVKQDLDSRISELELELKKRNDSEQAVNTMMNDMKRLVTLEKECSHLQQENKTLRQNKENVFLLKEKLLSVQEELQNRKMESENIKDLEIENCDLRCRLEKWESIASSPAKASSFLSQLQKSEINLTEQAGKLKSELLSTKTSLIEMEKQVSILQSQLKQSKDMQVVSSSNLKRLGRKLLLLSKECECYKNIISSYESEVTMGINDIVNSKVTSLENLVAEYKETLAGYESDLGAASEKSNQKETSENEILLKTEIRKLEHQVEVLQKQVQAYEALKEPPKQERVFHLSSNPVATSQQRQEQLLKRLKEENKELRSRVQVLEMGNITDVTLQAQQLIKVQGTDTVEGLREQITLAEQKNKRMMEAFKKTSHELREVVYLLTGYKIDLTQTSKYKLSHMYGESPHDFLLFEQTPDGEVHLLETDYSKSIDHLISDYLIKQNSLPAFLSNITLELFYRQTSVLNS